MHKKWKQHGVQDSDGQVMESTISIVANMKKMRGKSNKSKHWSLYPKARIWGDQSQLPMWGQWLSIADLVSLDRKKSKSGSKARPQKTLEDCGSTKLSILIGEWMNWLSIFTGRQTTPIYANCCLRVHMERTASSNGAIPSGHGGTERKCHCSFWLLPYINHDGSWI